MKLADYTRHDGLGLAALVAAGEVSPRELARAAATAIEAVNPTLGAVVETYPDRIDDLDERTLGSGPFRGVPFLMKDLFGHEGGRRIEFGSRLCRGMVAPSNSAYFRLARASGLNAIGRSAAPEYSLAGTTETALYGNTSTPWRHGFSAGGSSGGAMAAVVAGIVPVAHGSDIAGSIRIPASFCGGVGLKPSRGRVSFGPMVDETCYGLAQNFVQTKTMRDAAALLDALAVPQVGDPFAIPRPTGAWSELARRAPSRLRVAFSTAPLMGVAADPEVADAVLNVARWLADQGHAVEGFTPAFDGLDAMRSMMDVWFFGVEQRLTEHGARSGRVANSETLEPVTRLILEHARTMQPAQFLTAMAQLNIVRRQLGDVFAEHDVWLTPTTARTAEPWGRYNLGRCDLAFDDLASTLYAPVCQYTLPHNIMGTPALSLPLAMSREGLPIGVQFAARPANELLLLQLGTQVEQAMPWADRAPPLHAAAA